MGGALGEACRVLVFSSRALVAEALGRALARVDGMYVVAADGAEARRLAGRPDVILVESGVSDVIEELAPAAWSDRSVPLVLLVRHPDGWAGRAATRARAVGWLPDSVNLGVLAAALFAVQRTGRLPAGQARGAIHDSSDTRDLRLRTLTGHEREVLGLLASGHRADLISQRLSISVQTVRTHIQNIMIKLDAHTRLEAVALARGAGLFAGTHGSALAASSASSRSTA